MAQQVINIGTSPNDGTGDQLRTAFDKCNDNFTELYASTGGGAVDSVNGQTGVVVLDATDVDALQRDGSNANSDVELGAFSLNAKSFHAKGTAGAGHLGLKHQSSNATAPANQTSLFAGSDGELYYKNDGNAVEQIASETFVNTELATKITLNNWVDISLTSTIVGWSALTTRIIRYLDVGNAFIYYIFLNGTSNSTNVSFAIHYTPTINLNNFGGLFPVNNGSFLTGLAPTSLTAASNVVSVPVAQNSGATWLASGTKSVRGIIIVPKL